MTKITVDADEQVNIDPDYFDLVVQSLSVLSSIATIGASWLAFRESGVPRKSQTPDNVIEDAIRQIDRSFDDVFHHLRRVLAVLSDAYTAKNGSSLDDLPPRFGTATIFLTQIQFQSVSPMLTNIAQAAADVKQGIVHLEAMLTHSKPSGEDQINFDLSQFNDGLNDILFNSKTLGEATAKLNAVQARAEEFLLSVKRSIRGN
jgi:hypothetical protein